MYSKKLISIIENIFRCPKCQRSFIFCEEGLKCDNDHFYKIIDDIIFFREDILEEEVVLSANSWEKSHGRFLNNYELLENESDNPYIKSYWYYTKKFFNFFNKNECLYLDVGCGIAFNSLHLAQESIMTVNTDISLNALKISRDLFKTQGQEAIFVCADTLNLPFKNETFDFIFSSMSLEYFEDTEGAVRSLSQLIKTGGSLLAIVPVISFSTLYYQLSGNIWDVPIVKEISRWLHMNVLKGKFLKHGYDKSFRVIKLKNIFGKFFNQVEIGFFVVNYELKFLRYYWLIGAVKKILKYRLFWPLVYIVAKK